MIGLGFDFVVGSVSVIVVGRAVGLVLALACPGEEK